MLDMITLNMESHGLLRIQITNQIDARSHVRPRVTSPATTKDGVSSSVVENDGVIMSQTAFTIFKGLMPDKASFEAGNRRE